MQFAWLIRLVTLPDLLSPKVLGRQQLWSMASAKMFS
jgi:hypothetical protein